MAWYGLGVGLAIAILFIHPTPQETLFLGLGRPARDDHRRHRLRARRASASRSPSRRTATTGSGSRTPGRTRARCSTRSRPRSSTRSRSAARSSACCSRRHRTRRLANIIQALLYTLTTRLGASGRDRYLLVLTLGMGLIGGWLTAATGGIAAAFLGHAITRFAVFLCTGHAGQTKPRGREVEEIDKRRRPPEGWRVIGIAGVGHRGNGEDRAAAGTARRALRPHPVLRLALSRTATSSSTRARPPAGRKARVDAFVAALQVELDLRADALDAAFGRDAARPREPLPRRRDAVAAPARRASARLIEHVRRGSGSPTAPRSRSRPTPGRTSAATRPPGSTPAITRLSLGRAVDGRRAAAAARSAAPGRRRRRCRGGGARRGDRLGQPGPAVRRARTRRVVDWMTTLDAALDLAPDHLSLYALTLDDPDAEGLTGPTGDHLPTTTGARRWREIARPAQDEDRAAAQYHHAVDPARRSSGAAATRSATGRGPATRAATTWSTGSVDRTRRSARARTPSTARRAAGTRRASRGTSPR